MLFIDALKHLLSNTRLRQPLSQTTYDVSDPTYPSPTPHTCSQDLTDRKYKSESTVRELKAKLSTLEEEHQRARQELQVLRRDNARLDSSHHEHEKTINQMRTRVAVLEQEVKDKEELLDKTTAMCQSEQEHKVRRSSCPPPAAGQTKLYTPCGHGINVQSDTFLHWFRLILLPVFYFYIKLEGVQWTCNLYP